MRTLTFQEIMDNFLEGCIEKENSES